MKYRVMWVLCLLIIASYGQTHANSGILEKLRTTDVHVDVGVINDLYLMGTVWGCNCATIVGDAGAD